MSQSMYEKVEQFVDKSFKEKKKHFERTVFWLKELKSDCDEPMLIAAYGHDIESAFRKVNQVEYFKDKELNDTGLIKIHQETGAGIMSDFLKKQKYDKDKIDRITDMIMRHEEGGTEESDLLKDADSISYLETNAIKHVEKLSGPLGKDKVKRKIDFMFNRISSKKAREIARPFYDNVIKQLEAV